MGKVNFHSKAFRRGFFDGFTAYSSCFRSNTYLRTKRVSPSVKGAWVVVGKALIEAERVERGNIGKITRKNLEERAEA